MNPSIGRGLIALDTFLRLFQLRSPFLMLRIFTKYIAYWQHCFHISRLFRTLSNTWGFVSSLFTALVRTKSSPSWTLFYFSIICSERVGGITLPFFSFLPCLISIGRTFRFGAHFKYVHSKPFLLVFFVLVLFSFFFLFVYLVYIGDGAKALWFVKKDRRTRSTGSWLRRKQEENMSRDMLSRSLTDRRCYH